MWDYSCTRRGEGEDGVYQSVQRQGERHQERHNYQHAVGDCAERIEQEAHGRPVDECVAVLIGVVGRVGSVRAADSVSNKGTNVDSPN